MCRRMAVANEGTRLNECQENAQAVHSEWRTETTRIECKAGGQDTNQLSQPNKVGKTRELGGFSGVAGISAYIGIRTSPVGRSNP